MITKLDKLVRRINNPKDKFSRNVATEELITYTYQLKSDYDNLCDKIKLLTIGMEISE